MRGLAILERPPLGCYAGAYDFHAGMSVPQQLATLAHELERHRRGDDGREDDATEARINQAVARSLISPAEYALAERITGGLSASTRPGRLPFVDC